MVDIIKKDFSKGIDAHSSLSNIPDGYSEDVENFDTESGGYLTTRKGYEGLYGWVPIRVSQVEKVGTTIKFYVDDSQTINFANAGKGPLVVHGRTESAHSGDFTVTDSARYYPTYELESRKALSSGSNTLTISQSEHGNSTKRLFVGLAKSLSASTDSNETLTSDETRINATTYDIDIDYTSPAAEEAFIYITNKDAVAGTTYVYTATGSSTYTITQATHGLATINIIVKCYETISGEYTEIIPDDVYITPGGDVTVTFPSTWPSAGSAEIILTSTTKTHSETAMTGSNTITVPSPGSSFNFVNVYYFDSGDNRYYRVMPDSLSYDATADEMDVEYTIASGASPESAFIYWENATASASIISVEDTGSEGTSFSLESSPQITLWGLSHESIYRSSTTRGGHVNHLDGYKRSAEARLVAGLGGNLFACRTREEVGDSYLLPSALISMNERVNTTASMGPLFDVTGSSNTRTRGLITDDNVSSNLISVTAATYVSSTQMDFTLSFNSAQTLTGKIDADDKFTLSGMPYGTLNGSFDYVSVTDDGTAAPIIRLTVPNNQSRYAFTGGDGKAGCFTDRFDTQNNHPFIPSDKIITVTQTTGLDVYGADDDTVYLENLTSYVAFGAGLLVGAMRTSKVFQVRDTDNDPNAANFVRGDMLDIEGLDRKVRIVNINTLDDQTDATISGDGTEITVTLTAQHYLNEGQWIILANAGDYNGDYQVSEVTGTLTFKITSTINIGSTTGTLVGHTLELDESLTLSDDPDGTTISVDGRWIPIEAPENDKSYDLVKDTYVYHFDSENYESHTQLHSTMMNDNMYFVNNTDEVMKFDGTNIYRAGIYRWSPWMFTNVEAGSGITVGQVFANEAGAASGSKFTVALGEEALFTTGDRVYHTEDGAYYTVESVSDDGTNGSVIVSGTISGTAGTGDVVPVTTYQYYFRINMVDANDNILAGAATSHLDCKVELGGTSTIHHRLVGLPAWDNYDYDRLEVQMYRTAANGIAPYYLIRTVAIDFDNYDGYIDITDTTSDINLRASDFDQVHSVLLGEELGVGWSEPLRAKYISTVGNRLLLGNITGYPELDITLLKKSGSSSVSAANLNGFRWLFKKDTTDASTDTNMVDRAAYEFTTSSTTIGTGITETTTTFTVDHGSAHGLIAGDWVYLFSSTAGNDTVKYAGWWQISSADTNTFTIKYNNDGAAPTNEVDTWAEASTTTDIPVYLGTDNNYQTTEGNTTDSYENVAMTRLASAINATMRVTDVSVTNQGTFVPWLTANAGNDYNTGQLVVSQPRVLSTTSSVTIDTLAGTETFQIFINNTLRTTAEEVDTDTPAYPSRVLISYPRFPEIFDSPAVYDDSISDSAVDINAADGQEVTGIINFFGESAFGAAQLNDVAVVFKTNSIYILNVATKDYQRLDSRGLGCTAPRSIAATRNGIMFANESGIYRLNRDMAIDFVGESIERLWDEQINLAGLNEAAGHQYGVGRKYKLSVPFSTESYNTKALTYAHDIERLNGGRGSWVKYTNHPVVWWANLDEDAFFSTTNGQVFKIRNRGSEFDFRDDSDAIDVSFTSKMDGFGAPNIRKIISSAFLELQLDNSNVTSLSITSRMDFKSSFVNAGSITAASSTDPHLTARLSLPSRRGNYVQLKVTHSTKDEEVRITGLHYKVKPLTGMGITEAADFT